jgi:hypothetical protein
MERRPDPHFGEGPFKAEDEDEYDDEDEGRFFALLDAKTPS